MDIKYIKVGKWYNVPFRVVEIKSGDIHMENGGIKAVCQPSELSEITARQDVRPEHSTVGTLSYAERLDRLWNGMGDVLFPNGTKNTETAPKYDPCRKFKKGDKVHMKREVHGRPVYIGDDAWEPLDPNEIWSVEEDELETGWVHIKTSCVHASVWHGMLELVTPIEELEPYSVEDGPMAFRLKKGDKLLASYWRSHPNAKAAAEAERDRLNAEYRKETK